MNNNGDNQLLNGTSRGHSYIVSGDEMDRILASLSVAHGYVQLARRRFGQGQAGESSELGQVLARMEEATRAMAAELWMIMGAEAPTRGETGPD